MSARCDMTRVPTLPAVYRITPPTVSSPIQLSGRDFELIVAVAPPRRIGAL